MFSVFEDQIRQLIGRIADGEGLNADELMSKYLGEPLTVSTKTKKTTTTRAAKVTVSTTKCAATTAKGKPCSMNALAGSCMCRVHAGKEPAVAAAAAVASGSDSGASGSSEPPPVPKPKKSSKKKTRSADAPPVHEHELDSETHDDCTLCNTHGNALTATGENDDEEEFETVSSPRRSLRQRLMEIAHAEEDYDDEE